MRKGSPDYQNEIRDGMSYEGRYKRRGWCDFILV